MAQDKNEETQDQKKTAITSITYSKEDMTRYRNHAKKENLSLAKMIQVFFEEDIAAKQECKGSPDKTLQRIALRRQRLMTVGDNRLEGLKIDDLLNDYFEENNESNE